MNKKKIRIAIDILSDVPGQSGQVNIFKNLLNLLPDKRPDWEFFIFSTNNLNNYYQKKINKVQKNVHWINCWYDNSNGSVKRILTQEVQVPYLINKYKIDVFLCFPLPFITALQNVLTIYRHTCSISIINNINSKSIKYRLKKLLFSIKKADITIFNSNYERNNVKNLNVEAKDSKVIWESYDNKIFSLNSEHDSEIRDEVKELIKLNKKIIFIPTGLQPWKNSELVFKFIQNHKDYFKKEYIFVFTGSNNIEYSNNIKNKYNDIFESNLVYISGFCTHEEIAFIGKNALIIIYPSLIETFGIPPLEMMSLKKPVIISDIPPLLEISGDGSINFKHDSVEDLADKVFYLLNSDKERDELSNKGFNFVKQFSWERNAEETAILIDNLLLRK